MKIIRLILNVSVVPQGHAFRKKRGGWSTGVQAGEAAAPTLARSYMGERRG